VVGSTALLSRVGDARFVELLQTHNALARQAWAAHDGHEVKTAGDGFMVAFTTPRAAVEAAVAFQRSLQESESPMRVRVGIHAGDAVREEDDFFGQTVVVAARIGALASGGEILVSASVAAGLQGTEGITIGTGRARTLKGLDGRHQLLPVLWDGAPEIADVGDSGQRVGASVLVDRDEELGRLERLVAADAPGAVAYVEGAAGVGKSALLEAAADLAQDAGRVVLTARGGELERDFAFGLMRQALLPALGRPVDAELFDGPAQFAAAALGLSDGDPAVAAGDALGRAMNGLHWLCANLAERSPLLLICDDAHWADVESLQFLNYLARRVGELPIVLLIGTRPAEPGADMATLGALADQSEIFKPAPLSEAGSATLVGASYDASVSPEFTSACHRASGGNPFYLRALIAEAGEAKIDPTAEGAARVEHLGPKQIALATIIRIGRAAPGAAELAKAAAILGTSAAPRIAAGLAGLDPKRAAEVADALRVAGVFRMTSDLEFIHPVTRNAAINDTAPGERARLHRVAAGLLMADGAASDRIAAHLLACEPAGDAEVLSALRIAAVEARNAGAPSIAVDYLRRALEEPPPPAERLATLLELARVEGLADPAAAPEHFRAAFELASDATTRAEIALELYESLVPLEAREESRPVIERALEGFADRTDPLAMLLEKRLAELDPGAWYAWLEGQLARLGELEESAFTRELRLNRPMAVALGEIPPVPQELLVDDILTIRANSTPAQSGPGEKAGFAINCLHLERPDLAAELLAEAREAVAASGTERGRMRLLTVEAGVTANLAERESFQREAIELAERLGLQGALPGLRANLADVLVDRGHHEAAAEQLALGGLTDEYRGEQLGVYSYLSGALMFLLEVRGRMRLGLGDLEGGVRDLLDVATKGSPYGDRATLRATAAVAVASLGRVDEARELIAADMAWAQVLGSRRPLGRVQIASGLVEGGEEGLALLREATTTLAGVPLAAADHARAHVEYGAALRRAGSRKAARAELRVALDLSVAIGADGLASRAREELSASGARLTRERISGVDALTPSELRVARLVAESRTNREIAHHLFLSQKTVEMHVGRVLRKLDLKSRDGVAVVLADQGASDE
jgi:DNA-binding CsgD family transcriptional regulator